jgi:heat shock protein HslJ
MKRVFGFILPCIVIGAVVTGCSGKNSDSADLLGKTFMTGEFTVDGALILAAEGSEIALTFTQDGISMNAGCNTFFGAATLTDGTITIPAGTLGSTMMVCPEMLMAQEQALSTFFSSNPGYALDESTLTLKSPTTTITMTQR